MKKWRHNNDYTYKKKLRTKDFVLFWKSIEAEKAETVPFPVFLYFEEISFLRFVKDICQVKVGSCLERI